MSRDPQSMIPLTPAVFHIMLALSDGRLHGYGIMLEVEELTAGQTRLGPGTLYRSIQRMLVEGLIDESLELAASTPDDERRRYYRLTELGRSVARAEARRLATLVKVARTRKLLPRSSASRSKLARRESKLARSGSRLAGDEARPRER